MSQPRTGFYGKLPGVGDFVQRRLPAAFVGTWDTAFQAAVAGTRKALGERWHAAWREAPAWRFVLAPGVCGQPAWIGVMGPAVDRVGRGFPMVLACAVDDGALLARMLRSGGDWFADHEDCHRRGCSDAALAAETFDQRVRALPHPAASLERVGADAAVDADAGSWSEALAVTWQQRCEDPQLAALWARCNDAGDGCLWWTRGGPRVPPTAVLTHGLPGSSVYAGFVDRSLAPAGWPSASDDVSPAASAGQSAAPVILPDAVDADLADLLAPASEPRAGDGAGCGDPVAPAAAAETTLDTAAAALPPDLQAAAVAHLDDGRITVVVADNGPVDGRRAAAAQVMGLVTSLAAPVDLQQLGEEVSALHPALRQRRDDLIDPVAEDAAVVMARVADGRVALAWVGAVAAWHWRHGQLQALGPVAATAWAGDSAASPAPALADLVATGPEDGVPGLGADEPLQWQCAGCEIVDGDRLLLLAGDALLPLSAEVLSSALELASVEDTVARLAAAAGLDGDAGAWPLACLGAAAT